MQRDIFGQLEQGISASRFRPYSIGSGGDVTEAYGLYAWNVALSESLYPCLNFVEIALRNAIHSTVSTNFGDEYWFLNNLVGKEKSIVSGVRRELQEQGKSPTATDFVSSLWFGFWGNLFSNRYEGILWPHLLRLIFPYMPRRRRTIRNLHARLNHIRLLRNRVFHHEPIWHLPDLPEQHQQILETIGWISPAMLAMTRLLDRFPSVYTRGAQPYSEELENIAQNWAR